MGRDGEDRTNRNWPFYESVTGILIQGRMDGEELGGVAAIAPVPRNPQM